ncbi:MAG TPA: hypothetical protein VGG16_25810 [Streptosporangiaceae bacterium]|jgi:hypothetical protein
MNGEHDEQSSTSGGTRPVWLPALLTTYLTGADLRRRLSSHTA